MHILLIIVLSIISIIALLLVMALFIKTETNIVREITINKPKQEVFDYIMHIKNQDKYSKWNMADPGSKKEYKGTDGTIGFVYRWDSQNKNVGKGEQEIKNIIEGEKIEMELRFIRPFEGVSQTYMSTQTVNHQTKVKWAFKSITKYPFNLMSALMASVLGKDMETSLKNLKTNLEK